MSLDDPGRVFVYGTLRHDARGSVQTALTRGWEFETRGRVAAELFDFGAYPGAVPVTTGATVTGEVYRVTETAVGWQVLDVHEGDEFARALVDVTCEDGRTARAWIYWYRGERRGPRIISGDWLERA